MSVKENIFKASGYYSRYAAVMKIIVGCILVIASITFVIISLTGGKDFSSVLLLFALIFFLGGISLIIQGWLLWKRTASLVQGKFM